MMRASLEVWHGTVFAKFLNEHGPQVEIIRGGNDGVLITIDGNGKVTVRPPEGPGDPEASRLLKTIADAVTALGDRAAQIA